MTNGSHRWQVASPVPQLMWPVKYGSGLQIHLVVIETKALGEDRSNDNGCFDHEDDGNDHARSIRNSSRGIVICNDHVAHMSIVDPDATHAFEFPKYPDIIHAHLMLAYPELDELFVGQRFVRKDKCVDAIKHYTMNVSVDYRVADSKPTIYVGKCCKLIEGCKWRV
ncbi:hypothetical protein J1N35_000981 [Gossypium stocksii]|uniref:Transposase MuDR plant domain-containing protein n=1 Tax=Gossypium stocksii TaxID=47602 RepID=A0A9D4AL92_9ROSI|nr:hypothetical protein J1N35_000981 [Gossypium stocksii]